MTAQLERPGPASAPAVVRSPVSGAVLRGRGLSVRYSPRAVVVVSSLLLLTLVVAALGLTRGDVPIPPADVIRSLTGRGAPGADFVVLDLRLPRVVTGIAVGAALGVTGAIFQSLTRNALGSPDFIGLTVGASTGALVVILITGGDSTRVAVGAIVGCFATSLAVYALAFGRGAAGTRLVLIGIGMGAMLDAFNSFLIVRARLDEALAAQVWLVGSLNGRGWAQAVPVLLVLALLLPAASWLGGRMRLLEMGDDAAAAIGVPVERTRFGLLLIGIAMAAVATAAAGPVSFVALAAPQVVRRLTRSSGAGLFAAAAMGAAMLSLSDFVAQRAIPGTQLPVGIATGAVGGVYLTWLLVHEWRRGHA